MHFYTASRQHQDGFRQIRIKLHGVFFAPPIMKDLERKRQRKLLPSVRGLQITSFISFIGLSSWDFQLFFFLLIFSPCCSSMSFLVFLVYRKVLNVPSLSEKIASDPAALKPPQRPPLFFPPLILLFFLSPKSDRW